MCGSPGADVRKETAEPFGDYSLDVRQLLLGVLYVALVVYALVDVAQSDDEDRYGLPKWLWFGAIILLPLVGSIAWIVVAFTARRRKGRKAVAPWERATGNGPAGPPPAVEPPAGPEDDPEYMWLLEQAQRKKEREERRAGEGPAEGNLDGESPDQETGDENQPDDHPQNGDRPKGSAD
jgi:uncharacterized membrane protein YhdT